MGALDPFRRGEIRDGPRDLEDPIVGARRQRKFLHGMLQEIAKGGFDCAVPPELGLAHSRIRRGAGMNEAKMLTGTRRLHAIAKGRGRFAGFFRTQLRQGQRWGFDMQVDPIKQGAANPRAVTLDLGRPTTAFVFRITEVAARTWMRCQSATLRFKHLKRSPSDTPPRQRCSGSTLSAAEWTWALSNARLLRKSAPMNLACGTGRTDGRSPK